ncbi:MAG TPA: lipoprotein-releasing ABC transporter permease subunit [Burkholderiales bacterium]
MRYELLVGLRYTRAKRRNHFISVISLISMAGIALGVAALIVVLSVMNGFQEEIRTRILGVASHVQVFDLRGGLADWQGVAQKVAAIPRVRASAPYVHGQAMVTVSGAARGVLVRGVLPGPESRVTDIAQHMRAGSLDALKAGDFGVVIGGDLARAMRSYLGDKLVLIIPRGNVTPAGVIPRLKQFSVVGIFDVGYAEADSALALIHLADAQRLYQIGDAVSGVRLKLDDPLEARSVAREIALQFDGKLQASDWTRANPNLFRAIEIEKRMIFIIMVLIITVAAFNVVSTLVMLVTDKQADIAILRTLGAAPRSVMQIFIVQGAVIGVIGTLLGFAGGLALAYNVDVVVPALETVLGFKFLSKDVYQIPDLPSKVEGLDVAIVCAVSLVLSLLATLYPSWRASRVNPAEALRYE